MTTSLHLDLHDAYGRRLLMREMHRRRAATHQQELQATGWWQLSWRSQQRRLVRQAQGAERADDAWLQHHPDLACRCAEHLLDRAYEATHPLLDRAHLFRREVVADEGHQIAVERTLSAARAAVLTAAHGHRYGAGELGRIALVTATVPELADRLTTWATSAWLSEQIAFWEQVRRDPVELHDLPGTDCSTCAAVCPRQQAIHPRTGIAVTAVLHTGTTAGQHFADVAAHPVRHPLHPDPVTPDLAFGLGIGQACYRALAQANPHHRFTAATLKIPGVRVRQALHRTDPFTFDHGSCPWCAEHLPASTDPAISPWKQAARQDFTGHR